MTYTGLIGFVDKE